MPSSLVSGTATLPHSLSSPSASPHTPAPARSAAIPPAPPRIPQRRQRRHDRLHIQFQQLARKTLLQPWGEFFTSSRPYPETPLRAPLRLIHIMRRHKNRRPLAAQVIQQIPHLLPVHRSARRRLIRNSSSGSWISAQATAATASSPRQAPRRSPSSLQVRLPSSRRSASPPPPAPLVRPSKEPQVLQHRQVRVQTELLRHIPELRPDRIPVPPDILPSISPAHSSPRQPAQHPHRSRLPAHSPQEPENLPGGIAIDTRSTAKWSQTSSSVHPIR